MAVMSKAMRKAFTQGLVSAFPSGVLVDTEGRAVSAEFAVGVNDAGDVTNVDQVRDITGTPDMIRLLDGNGAWYEIDLPSNWLTTG